MHERLVPYGGGSDLYGGGSDLYGRLAMTMAMRGVVLALLVLRRVPGSHSPTMCIEGGLQNCPWAVGGAASLSLNSVSDQKLSLILLTHPSSSC